MSEEAARKRSRTDSASPNPPEHKPAADEDSDEEVGPLPVGNDEKGQKKTEKSRKKGACVTIEKRKQKKCG